MICETDIRDIILRKFKTSVSLSLHLPSNTLLDHHTPPPTFTTDTLTSSYIGQGETRHVMNTVSCNSPSGYMGSKDVINHSVVRKSCVYFPVVKLRAGRRKAQDGLRVVVRGWLLEKLRSFCVNISRIRVPKSRVMFSVSVII